jgi:steroid 5-alpha reductase family enzyme
LWVFVTTLPVHVSNFSRHISGEEPAAWNVVDSVGLLVWVIGFAIEVIADEQKSAFRKQSCGAKHRKWISSGLWA